MFKITETDKCTGCGACSNICPLNCIKIKPNEKNGGFLEPHIDYNKCIKCNSCINVCPINTIPSIEAYEKKAYACINKDINVRINSTSGGIFSLLADYVIKNNGVVFGAMYDDEMRVIHSYANTMDDVYKFMGSKYVQSFTGSCYKMCKEYLDQGIPVLFTGTPCQIGGLKKFLRKDYDNLICQDLICHGVPSSVLWNKYLDHLEKKYKHKVVSYIFRSKYKGWNKPGIEIVFDNDKHKYSFLDKETYSKFFLDYSSLRESCYDCKFRGDNHVSDITLGDFWGVENVLPEKYDNKGTSIVIIHTEKGMDVFNKISEYIDYTEVSMEKGLEKNPSFYKSPYKSKHRNKLVLNTYKLPYNKLIYKYGKYVLVKMETKRLLKPIYHFAKKMLK